MILASSNVVNFSIASNQSQILPLSDSSQEFCNGDPRSMKTALVPVNRNQAHKEFAVISAGVAHANKHRCSVNSDESF